MLIRLYSETDLLLKPVVFTSGINIILGKYSKSKNEVKGKGINGIGKSSLVRLVDFLLLSNAAEKIFLQARYDFLRSDKHNAVLEFKQNEVTYFVKRTFGKEDDVFFGTSSNDLMGYKKQELKKILAGIFFPFQDDKVFFEGERYGTLMDFFIKDDLENQQRIDPLNFSQGTKSQIDKAVFNFFLYGLPTKELLNFGELVNELEQFSRSIKGVEKNIKIDNKKSIEELKSDQIKINEKINMLEKSLDNYTFLDNYRNIEKDLVDITEKINGYLKEYHVLNGKLKKIKESFQNSSAVDTKEIQNLYNEVSSTFGDLVSKTLEELISFKSEILENRNKFLIKKEQELQKAIDKLLGDISVLEQTRSGLYKRLEEKGALDSITNTYEQLTREKTQLAGNLRILEEIDRLKEKVGNLQVTLSEVKNNISVFLRQSDGIIGELRRLFLEVLQNAIILEDDDRRGYFDISAKPDSPRNQFPFKIEVEIPKTDGLGPSRLKIVAYDLMVFLHNINLKRTMPHFIIHDGVFHGISLDTTIKALNYIYHQHLQNPCFQYITTFNEHEIYVSDDRKDLVGSFDFKLDDVVVAEYTDNPEQMIFKRNFK